MTRLTIINGFDRCGSSMIGALLASHPDVTYFFQPFSGSEVHRTQFEIWGPDRPAPATEAFLTGLEDGRLDPSYISSDWFAKHSTASQPNPSGINLIKETKLHYKLAWLSRRFPHIERWGVWRDPRGILCSLLRNDFYHRWYGEELFGAASRTIQEEPLLEDYRPWLEEELADFEKMALIVGSRTHFMVSHIPRSRFIVYEEVVDDPNRGLAPFTAAHRLEPWDFAAHARKDFNVVGLPYESRDQWREWFSADQLHRLDTILAPLMNRWRC